MRNRYWRRCTFMFGHAFPLTMITLPKYSGSQYGWKSGFADRSELDGAITVESPIRQHERNLELPRGKERCDVVVLRVADDEHAFQACGQVEARQSQSVVVIPEQGRQLAVEVFEGGALKCWTYYPWKFRKICEPGLRKPI